MDDELICFEGLFRASYVGPCQCYEVENMDRTAHEKPHSPLWNSKKAFKISAMRDQTSNIMSSELLMSLNIQNRSW